MLYEDRKVRLHNLGTTNNLQTIKLNATLDELVAKSIEDCFRNIRIFSIGIISISKEFHHVLVNIVLYSTQPFHLLIK
jgi:hypothetical protein